MRLASQLFASILLISLASAHAQEWHIIYSESFTGADLFNEPTVTFPNWPPSVVGDALVFPRGAGRFEKRLVLPLVSADEVVNVSAVDIAFSIQLTRRSNDFDPLMAVGDGANLVSFQIADNSNGSGIAHYLIDEGNVVSQIAGGGIVFGNAGFPNLGESIDVSGNFALFQNSARVDGAFLGSSGSRLFAPINLNSGLEFVFISEQLGELYELNSLGITVAVDFVELPGDFDGDLQYTCSDVNLLSSEIATGGSDTSFDLTGDDLINDADLHEWLTIAGTANLPSGEPYLLADANLDGTVDVSDYNIWHDNRWTVNTEYCSGDFNANGSIDVSDFNIWFGNKFQSAGNVSLVPEPGYAAILRVFVLLLVILSRPGMSDRRGGSAD